MLDVSMDDNSGEKIAKHQACDECRRRKLKCTKEAGGCFRCLDYKVPCVYSPQQPMGRPQKRISGQKMGSARSNDDFKPSYEYSPHRSMVEITMVPEEQSPKSLLQATPSMLPFEVPELQSEHQQQISFGTGGIYSPSSIDFSSLSIARPADADLPRPSVMPNKPCFCARNFCSALQSLLNIPDGLECALQTTRQASRAVYEALECSQCGIPPLDQIVETRQVPRPQFIIMIVSIFPALVAAYRRIQNLADTKAAEAKKDGLQIPFRLGMYGGLWGPLSTSNRKCQEYYEDCTVDANTWRSTIGALLKADIYGFDLPSNPEENMAPYHHRGLWDFVKSLKAMSATLQDNEGRGDTENCHQTTSKRSDPALQEVVDGGMRDSINLVAAIGIAYRSLQTLNV